jgi:hypothetical protein
MFLLAAQARAQLRLPGNSQVERVENKRFVHS